MQIKLVAAAIILGATLAGPAMAQARLTATRPTDQLTGPSVDQQILSQLQAMNSQINALRQQVDQQGEMLKALQINMNLTLAAADKTRVAAVNDGTAIQNLQAEIGQVANNTVTLQSTVDLQGMKLLDMSRRLYMTCYLSALAAGGSLHTDYSKDSCTAVGWAKGAFNFDTPFMDASGHVPAKAH